MPLLKTLFKLSHATETVNTKIFAMLAVLFQHVLAQTYKQKRN